MHRIVTPLSRRGMSAALLTVSALVVVLSACTAPQTPSPNATTQAGSSTASTRDEYDLLLARCLRDAGFDVKDPLPGEGISEYSPEIAEAASICMAQLGDPPVEESSLSETEALELGLAAAACIRRLGFDFPDPTLEQPIFIPAEIPYEQVAVCFENYPDN